MGGFQSTRHGSKNSKVIEFDSEQEWKLYLEESKRLDKLIVVDFSASWCGPCRYMEPIIKELADKFTEVEFVKIDVDKLTGVAKEFGIRAMPTFVFIKKGKEVDQLVGADAKQLERMIHQYRV